jgi:hypothetical protein
MSTNQHQQITREMRTYPTDDRIKLREEAKACESCDRNDNGVCLASGRGLSWQEMSRMEPAIGGCGTSKVKWRAKQ